MEHSCNLAVENCAECSAAEHDPGEPITCPSCARGKHDACEGYLCDWCA